MQYSSYIEPIAIYDWVNITKVLNTLDLFIKQKWKLSFFWDIFKKLWKNNKNILKYRIYSRISPWAYLLKQIFYSRIKFKFLKISFANKPMGLFQKFLISNDFNGDFF